MPEKLGLAAGRCCEREQDCGRHWQRKGRLTLAHDHWQFGHSRARRGSDPTAAGLAPRPPVV